MARRKTSDPIISILRLLIYACITFFLLKPCLDSAMIIVESEVMKFVDVMLNLIPVESDFLIPAGIAALMIGLAFLILKLSDLFDVFDFIRKLWHEISRLL